MMGPLPSSSTLLKIKVTLWKNYIIRRHHWLATLLEVALPALLFAFFAYLRSSTDVMVHKYINTTSYAELHGIEEVLGRSALYSYTFLYAPNSTFTNKLMGDLRTRMEIANDGKRFGIASRFLSNCKLDSNRILFFW